MPAKRPGTTRLIGICGGSGCGKTTLSRALHRNLEGRASLLSMDSYYVDRSHMSDEEVAAVNFDHPESMDMELLFEHLQGYIEGVPIDVPHYDFHTHSRTGVSETIDSAEFLIIEGILALHDERLRRQFDLKIYVDAGSDIRLMRRLRRDISERGRDVNSVLDQYERSVLPMFRRYVEPQEAISDLVLNGDGSVAIEELVAAVMSSIDQG